MPWVYADTGEEVPTDQLPYLEAAERHAAAPRVEPPREAPPGVLRSAADVALTAGLGPLHEATTPLGRRVQGAREAAWSVGTGALAFPAGVVAQVASPGPQAFPGPDFESSAAAALAAARARRRAVEEALTYRPRTPEGQEALETVGQVVSPGFTRPVARAAGQKLGPEAEDAVAVLTSPLTWLGPEARALGGAVRRGGQRAAVRTLGATPAAAGRMAELRGQAGMQELGQTVLDIPGARLRQGPKGVYEPPKGGPVRAAMDPVGKRLDDIASVAGERGGEVDLGGVLERFDAATQGLMKDPFARERLAKVRDYVAETAQGRGVWTPDQRQLMRLTPEEAWGMRRGLDDVIYDAARGLRRNSPITAEFSRLRGLVDDALGESVESSLGPEVGRAWAQANRMYHNLADVRRLAKVGYRQQAGAEFAPPVGSELRFGAGTGYRMPVLSRFMTRYPVQPKFGATAARARLSQLLAGPPPEELLPLGF